jgi:hypothetical protein
MTKLDLKHEWRRAEKSLYLPKAKPELVEVPAQRFITLYGEGNPNSAPFLECISALYSVAYGIKMTLKKESIRPEGYCDFTVYPLEGIWDITDAAKQTYNGTLNKDDLVFTLMIRQPDFVSPAYFEQIMRQVQLKKPQRLLDQVKFETITEGRCIQMMHVGPYDDEPATFEQMEAFATSIDLERKSKIHREIYISDFRRTAPERLKTVLRFQVN